MELEQVAVPVFPALRTPTRPVPALKRSDAILADSVEEFMAKLTD